MTKKELIKLLEPLDDNTKIVMFEGGGLTIELIGKILKKIEAKLKVVQGSENYFDRGYSRCLYDVKEIIIKTQESSEIPEKRNSEDPLQHLRSRQQRSVR